MRWFAAQSLLFFILLPFLLGLVVGYLWWVRQLRKISVTESTTVRSLTARHQAELRQRDEQIIDLRDKQSKGALESAAKPAAMATLTGQTTTTGPTRGAKGTKGQSAIPTTPDPAVRLQERIVELEAAQEKARATADRELATVRGKVATLEGEVAAATKAGSGTTTRLEGELAATKTRATELQADLATAATKAQTLQAELAIADTKSKTLQAELAASETKSKTLQTELAGAKQDVPSPQVDPKLSEQLAGALAQLKEARSEADERSAAHAALEARHETTRRQLVELATARDRHADELARRTTELAEARRVLDAVTQGAPKTEGRNTNSPAAETTSSTIRPLSGAKVPAGVSGQAIQREPAAATTPSSAAKVAARTSSKADPDATNGTAEEAAVPTAGDVATAAGSASAIVTAVTGPSASATSGDEIERVEGIGPRTADALRAAGITSFSQLAATSEARLRELMRAEGLPTPPSVGSWAKQGELLAKNDETGFKTLTDRLDNGREPDSNLERIEGIGKRTAEVLRAAGIRTFTQVANAKVEGLSDVLQSAGLIPSASLGTWGEQSALLEAGDEAGFKALTDRLAGGRREGTN